MSGRSNRTATYRHFISTVDEETDECIVWPFPLNRNGYGRVCVDAHRDYVHVHALLRHQPRPFPGAVVRHGPCHNAACYNPRHLSWGTQAENVRDMLRDGIRSGPARRLTNEDAASIRASAELGRVLAERYGVSHSTIKAIRQGRIYR